MRASLQATGLRVVCQYVSHIHWNRPASVLTRVIFTGNKDTELFVYVYRVVCSASGFSFIAIHLLKEGPGSLPCRDRVPLIRFEYFRYSLFLQLL